MPWWYMVSAGPVTDGGFLKWWYPKKIWFIMENLMDPPRCSLSQLSFRCMVPRLFAEALCRDVDPKDVTQAQAAPMSTMVKKLRLR